MPPLLTIASVIKPPAQGFDKTVASVQREFAEAEDLEFLIKVKSPPPQQSGSGSLSGSGLGHCNDFLEDYARIMESPDAGVFDGMNQALAAAKGEWILFLNAGDWLEPGFANAFRAAVAAHPQADYLTFHGCTVDACDGRSFQRLVPEQLRFSDFLKKTPVLHPCFIVRTPVLRQYGMETHFTMAADFSLMVRMVADNRPGVAVDHFAASMISGGISNRNRLKARWQATQALIRHGGSAPFKRSRALFSYLRYLLMHILIYHGIRRIPWLRQFLIRMRSRIRNSHA